MYEAKTKPTAVSVDAFLDAIEDDQARDDCRAIAVLMEKITKEKPRMWGLSIVGFGTYHYQYASGHEGDSMLTGFSPRKGNITLYLMPGLDHFDELFDQLGKHKRGKGCLYIKRLSDVHLPTLKKLITESVKHLKKLYPAEPSR